MLDSDKEEAKVRESATLVTVLCTYRYCESCRELGHSLATESKENNLVKIAW